MLNFTGKAVQKGTAIGNILVLRKTKLNIEKTKVLSVDEEKARAEKAIEESKTQLSDLYNKVLDEKGSDAADIIGAHQMMLEDDNYIEYIFTSINEEQCNAEYAVEKTCEYYMGLFNALEDEYLRERATDIKDVSDRIIRNLMGTSDSFSQLNVPSIIVADDLTPSETIQMDKEKILAMVTCKGSENSHTAILARMMNIPAIVMAPLDLNQLEDGMDCIVDGNTGNVYFNPSEEILEKAKTAILEEANQAKLLEELIGKETITKDGRRIELCANIGSDEDLAYVIKNDGEGIGLFRSEFLYLGRDNFPSEEEQFIAYKNVLEGMKGKRVVIRTLDIGADKKVDYFGLDEEENPALGYRAIRICLSQPEIFITQLRALFRASVYGKLAIMYPMITSVSEIEEIKGIVNEVKMQLKTEGIAFGNPEQGIMIETPAAALVSDDLAKMVDFFSVGTNDLTQYTLAIDRQNDKLDRFCDRHHKAIMRLIEMAAKNIHKEGKWIGICGELGADMSLTEEFLRLGIDELSVSPSKILKLREKIRSL